MRKYLLAKRGWDDTKDKQLVTECTDQVEQAVRDFEAIDPPHPADIFNHMYAEMPWHLQEQKEEMLASPGRIHEVNHGTFING